MVKNRVLSNVVSLLQRFQYMNVAFLVHDLQVDFSIDNEINVLAVFLEAEDLITLLIDHFLHMVLNLYKEFVIVALSLEVVNLH